MKYTIKSTSKKLLADTLTPVNIYLKLRDVFAGSILLESSDYHGQENSLSMICCDSIASFQIKGFRAEIHYPDGAVVKEEVNGDLISKLESFRNSFDAEAGCGLFGYMNYDAVRFFEDIPIIKVDETIPDVLYKLYRYVIVVDHFSNQLTLTENTLLNSSFREDNDGLSKIEQLIFSNRFSTYSFQSSGDEAFNVSDDQFVEMVKKGIEHCNRGDVFQIVMSRRFSSHFKGDEFNVYRALRSINPSPYLFYFDYGSFKLFGSSPEAQLQVKNSEEQAMM
jgi:anthranilate synthase component 1